MNTIEREVGIGLAYLYARDTKGMKHFPAWRWAKKHWSEFLTEMDTETGKLLVYMAHHARNQERQ